MPTKIEWADETLSPIRARLGDKGGWACQKVSPGCAHCYAQAINKRRGTRLPYSRAAMAQVETYLDEAVLRKVISWRKPRRIFWESMSDLFGWWVTDEMLDRCFASMALTPQHTHLVLSKRPERAREYLAQLDIQRILQLQIRDALTTKGSVDNILWNGFKRTLTEKQTEWIRHKCEWEHMSWLGVIREWGVESSGEVVTLPNVWPGTSIENRATAAKRVPELLSTRAAVRFLSIEPLLEEVDIRAWMGCEICGKPLPCGCGFNQEPGLDLVLVGGESGPGARPCDLAWIRGIVEQCEAAGVSFFCKQAGSVLAREYNRLVRDWAADGWWEAQDLKGGRIECFPEDLRVRQWPEVARG